MAVAGGVRHAFFAAVCNGLRQRRTFGATPTAAAGLPPGRIQTSRPSAATNMERSKSALTSATGEVAAPAPVGEAVGDRRH
jgi:hypothetical protein